MANYKGDLNVDVGARLNKLEQGLKAAEKDFKKFSGKVETTSKSSSSKMSATWSNAMTGVGGAIAAAFSVQAIASFTREAVTLAAKAEGVEAAFKRLNDATLLDDLRRATRGTITDVELMRQAVRAQNFKVPLNQLATFFEFATKRAAQTGESVDYLVNSIIDGIGRKSTLVMDNLGISAAQLQAEIKKTGDFGKAAGNIIAEELEKAGDVATTSAQKIDKITASWKNLSTEVGKKILGGEGDFLGQLSEFIDGIARSIKVGGVLTREEIRAYDKNFKETTERVLKNSDELIKKYGSVEEAQKALINESISYQVKSNKQIGVNSELANSLLGISEGYKEAANRLGSLNQQTETATLSQEQLSASIMAQADALIKARQEAEKYAASLSLRMDAPKTPSTFEGFGVDPSAMLGQSTKHTKDNNDDYWTRTKEQATEATAIVATFGNALNQAFTEGIDNGLNFGDAMQKMLEDLAKQMAAALLTALALKAVFSLIPGIGQAQSFGSLFLGQMGLGGLINANQASGGVAGGMGKMNVNVSGVIKGNDLLLVSEKAQRVRTRERGF